MKERRVILLQDLTRTTNPGRNLTEKREYEILLRKGSAATLISFISDQYSTYAIITAEGLFYEVAIKDIKDA